eukprot:6991-Heterococcus_DN1.PRE.4
MTSEQPVPEVDRDAAWRDLCCGMSFEQLASYELRPIVCMRMQALHSSYHSCAIIALYCDVVVHVGAARALTHPFVIRQNVFAAMEMQLVSIRRYKPLRHMYLKQQDALLVQFLLVPYACQLPQDGTCAYESPSETAADVAAATGVALLTLLSAGVVTVAAYRGVRRVAAAAGAAAQSGAAGTAACVIRLLHNAAGTAVLFAASTYASASFCITTLLAISLQARRTLAEAIKPAGGNDAEQLARQQLEAKVERLRVNWKRALANWTAAVSNARDVRAERDACAAAGAAATAAQDRHIALLQDEVAEKDAQLMQAVYDTKLFVKQIEQLQDVVLERSSRLEQAMHDFKWYVRHVERLEDAARQRERMLTTVTAANAELQLQRNGLIEESQLCEEQLTASKATNIVLEGQVAELTVQYNDSLEVIAAHELHIEGLHVQLDTVTQERDTALQTSENRAVELITAHDASTALQLELDAAIAG